ncbi:ABC transporter substrate-binding protein [Nocardioides hwasunensis]|uniref:ABC transporter substrate-binding protein n=1 Tax=Nocardioides hwasunensis TaxID=397258 RepID=A0ABR8ML96_9ACTN|nr:ABC transporter substrate-binding protein [Nocardioides hwasunensis]MBD3914839.1 ABC transporter substrate-binding protein [Nocardioides hwasunensis]
MTLTRAAALALTAVLLPVVAGCASTEDATGDAGPAGSADTGARTLTDDAGAEVSLEGPVERIACLTMICVDALVEVGITPVAYRDQLALDDRYVGPGSDMREITGGFGEENVEDVALSEPDLVIGLSGAHDGLREAVEEVAPLYLVDPRSWQDSVAFLRLVGELTGTEDEAEAAAVAFEQRVADLEATGLTTVSMFGEPGSLGVDSVETPVGSLLAEVGDYPWPAAADAFANVSVEQVAEVDPDVVFAQTFSSGSDAESLAGRLAQDPVWARMTAAREDRVVEVDAGVWATGRGTISLGLVLDEAVPELQG